MGQDSTVPCSKSAHPPLKDVLPEFEFPAPVLAVVGSLAIGVSEESDVGCTGAGVSDAGVSIVGSSAAVHTVPVHTYYHT